MKTFLLLAIGLAVVSLARAAHKRSVSKRMLAREGVSVSNLAREMNLGERSGFREGGVSRNAKGHNQQRLRQTFEGLDVVGATSSALLAGQGVLAVRGDLVYGLENDIPDTNACRRETRELVERAKTYLTIGYDTPLKYTEAMRKIHLNGNNGTAKLVYQLEFLVELAHAPSRPFFLMDACNPGLDVIVFFDQIPNNTVNLQREQRETSISHPTRQVKRPTGACPSKMPAHGVGGNPKTGKITYGVNYPYCLETHGYGNRCRLWNWYASVVDLKNSDDTSKDTEVNFECAKGYSDPVNGAYGVAMDALFNANNVASLFHDWDWYFWYTAIVIKPGYPKIKVHYRTCYDGAFYDSRDIVLGDGCKRFYPLVSTEVIAHEIAHLITVRHSKLTYSGQSGAIHESFCDITGEIAEFYLTSTTNSAGTNDWVVGRQVLKKDSATRYFERPSRDGCSIDSANDYRSGMSIYCSSGVFNRAFWQLVNDQRLPMKQSYEIFLKANLREWNENTNFQDGACGVMRAAHDLGFDVNKVKAAFRVVDIDLTNCVFNGFAATIASREARPDVKVSSIRNPVFTLKVRAGDTARIDVGKSGDDPHVTTVFNVTVSVTSDAAGGNVVTSGVAPFVFDVTADTAYFKISTPSDKDTDVTVSVLDVSET